MQGKALILTDGKAGHENQSKALARALGLEAELLPVKFRSPLAKAASYLLDRLGIKAGWVFGKLDCGCLGSGGTGCLGSGRETGDGRREDAGFRVVVGTGSGAFYAAKVLAARLGVPCAVVLYPRGYRIGGFGCVMAPAFDRPAKARNVVEIPANLVASDEAFYAAGVAAFRERYSGKADNLVGVIVGGPNKCSTMTADWIRARLDETFASNRGAQMCVTTSRRTPPDVEAVVDSYPWAYKLIYSRDRFNPIPAFVKLAKRLYVTAESTGMLSEACTCGSAEVFALDNLNPGPHKFRRFVEGLAAGGYVGGKRKVDLTAEFARARELLGLT